MRRLAVIALLPLCACACGGGGSEKHLTQSELSRAVLQRADLPSWTRFQDDAGTAADSGLLGSSDRVGAWISRFRGPQGIVVSRIDLYRDAKAAADVLGSFRTTVAGTGVSSMKAPALGDERIGYEVGTPATLESILWRRANAIVSVVLQGSGLDAAAAGRIARLEDARIDKVLR